MKSSTPQTETITSPITTPASNSEPINPIKINIPQLTVPEVIPIPLKVELPPPLDPSAQIGERFYGKHGEKIYMSQQAEEQKQPTLEETL
ncbi:MAG: hypothetical protein LBG52_06845 [Candidatus Peribacteria bacterium]|jgi:hypothetical protein|nr:hypothetical protein [Candidatus Peribacteria bacterium]